MMPTVKGRIGRPSSPRGIAWMLYVFEVTVCALSLFGFVLRWRAEGCEAELLPLRVRKTEELFLEAGLPFADGGGEAGPCAEPGGAPVEVCCALPPWFLL